MTSGGSGFVVGPEGADAIELIALLGAGGEGEVWQARVRRPGEWGEPGDEIAIKVARHDPADARWPAVANLLRSLRHPGLVRVRSIFTGPERRRADEIRDADTHRYVVMDYEAGLTLSQWLQEHPDASRAERTRLLNQLAVALDALHAGSANGEPVAHGDVKPGNVIVRPDGSTVLVDLGLSRSTSTPGMRGHTTAYTAPEFHTGDIQATTEGDAYAFVVTTAQTLTGMPLPTRPDGYLSKPALAKQLRVAPATRRDVLLARHIIRTLAARPDARPGELTAWLRRPHRQLAGMLSVLVVLLLMGSAVGIAAWPSSARHSSAIGPSTVSTPRSTGQGVAGVAASSPARSRKPHSTASGSRHPSPAAHVLPASLTGSGDWSLILGDPCFEETGSSVAGAHAPIPANPYRQTDISERIIDKPEVGVWGAGELGFYFTVSGPGDVALHDVRPTSIRRLDAGPAWIYHATGIAVRTDTGSAQVSVCGTSSVTAPPPSGTEPLAYSFRDVWNPDTGLNTVRRAVVDGSSIRPSFGETVLRPIDSAAIDMSMLSCLGNYSFQVDVTWSAYGEKTVRHTLSNRFYIYGRAHDASLVQSYTKDHKTAIQTTTFSGSDAACAARTSPASKYPTIIVASPTPNPAPSAPTPSAPTPSAGPTP